MDREQLKFIQQLYENSVFRTALYSPEAELLWSNAPDFFSELQTFIIEPSLEEFTDSTFRQEQMLLTDVLQFTQECRFTIVHQGERHHLRVLPLLSGGTPDGILLQASGLMEFYKFYGWTNTGNETMRQIAGIRTAVSEIVATNSVLYHALEGMGKYELIQLLSNQISSCYKALSVSINLAEMVKYNLGYFRETRSNASIFLEDILSVCAAYLRDTGVEIIRHIQPDVCMALDYDKFTAVVLNLVVNSVQNNISEDKKVIVSLRKSRSEIVFSVEDNGIGIPPDKLSMLFVPHALSEKYSEKSGLGLPLCKMFADHYDATVTVSSQMDFGTQIFLRFPRQDQSDCDGVPRLESPSKKYVSERFSPLYVYLSKVAKIRFV